MDELNELSKKLSKLHITGPELETCTTIQSKGSIKLGSVANFLKVQI